jgi:2-haloacid dehalogenase
LRERATITPTRRETEAGGCPDASARFALPKAVVRRPLGSAQGGAQPALEAPARATSGRSPIEAASISSSAVIAVAEIRALLFDVFGTCVDWRTSVARESEAFGRTHRVTGVDWTKFADAWRARYQPQMETVRSGARGWTNLDTLHRESLDEVCRAFGIADVSPAALDGLNRAWHRLDPWPDTVEGLRRLKTKFIIAPHSNGNVALMVDMAKRAGIPWDAVLGAEIARAYKPMPEAYLRNVAILGLAPPEVMMVAAHEGDLKAARSCGLRTGFVARPLEFGPGGPADTAVEGAWDVVASDFLDLARRMEC